MSSHHSFDIEIAQIVGVNAAIFLNNIAYWTEKNIANNKHFYDGRYWTYNSQKAFSILFPYWSRKNIRTIIAKCIKNKLIVVGNYNTNKYDQTCWYAFDDNALMLYPRLEALILSNGRKRPMEVTKAANQLAESGQPIPDINTDTKNIYIPKIEKTDRKKPKTKIPDDYKYNESHIMLSKEVGIFIEDTLEEFKDHALANDRRCSNWDAAFRNWIRKANDFKPKDRQEKKSFNKNVQNSNKPRQETSYASVESQSTAHLSNEDSDKKEKYWREIGEKHDAEVIAAMTKGATHGSEAKVKPNDNGRNKISHNSLYPSMRKATEYLPPR